jgi:hypothetical protein
MLLFSRAASHRPPATRFDPEGLLSGTTSEHMIVRTVESYEEAHHGTDDSRDARPGLLCKGDGLDKEEERGNIKNRKVADRGVVRKAAPGRPLPSSVVKRR